jgi:acetate kinase
MPGPSILVLNAGSSTLKFSVHEAATLARVASGQIDRGTRLEAIDAARAPIAAAADFRRRSASETDDLLDWLSGALPGLSVVAAGHRVVHGGAKFVRPVRVDASVLEAIEALTDLAPLHQPVNAAPIHALWRRDPALPQVACFDTAFHATQPAVSTRFALPRHLHDAGVRRYGFHGLSYEHVASRLPELLGRRAGAGAVVVAHLGSGASACAMREGRSVASTMGFTALDGLMMGTRCGALDPGAVLHLVERLGGRIEAVSDLLYHRSGLLGVSTLSADMRVLRASPDPRARDAIELFCATAARAIGSLAVAIEGLDALVFTAGIGENDPATRAAICAPLAFLGVSLDARANDRARGEAPIHAPGSRVQVWVVPTDEERVILRSTARLALGLEAPPHA